MRWVRSSRSSPSASDSGSRMMPPRCRRRGIHSRRALTIQDQAAPRIVRLRTDSVSHLTFGAASGRSQCEHDIPTRHPLGPQRHRRLRRRLGAHRTAVLLRHVPERRLRAVGGGRRTVQRAPHPRRRRALPRARRRGRRRRAVTASGCLHRRRRGLAGVLRAALHLPPRAPARPRPARRGGAADLARALARAEHSAGHPASTARRRDVAPDTSDTARHPRHRRPNEETTR